MSLIDQAARALSVFQGGTDWELLDAETREQFTDAVRVVLRALHDPDERMVEAGVEIIRNVGPAESAAAHLSDTTNTWRFMIDALLGEKG